MADKQKISDYLKECGVFYFATVADGAPAVRPIGFQMCHEGELYFGIGTHKDVYAQIQATPKVSIAATKPDGKSWIRINGDIAFDYVLREGRAEGRNAIRLLAGVGFPPEVTEGAAECAAHFEETGEWRL